MNAIWKFPLRFEHDQRIDMPAGATVLHVAMQGELLCVWAQVDTGAYLEARRFDIFGTGHEIAPPDAGKRQYVGTVHAGVYVWHVFERVSVEVG